MKAWIALYCILTHVALLYLFCVIAFPNYIINNIKELLASCFIFKNTWCVALLRLFCVWLYFQAISICHVTRHSSWRGYGRSTRLTCMFANERIHSILLTCSVLFNAYHASIHVCSPVDPGSMCTRCMHSYTNRLCNWLVKTWVLWTSLSTSNCRSARVV